MSFESIRMAVESRMAVWNGAPVAFDNVPASQAVLDAQAAKEPWVRLTIQHGTSTAPYKGSEPGIRRTGLIMVQVFTAESEGSRPAALLADSLAAHLQFYSDGQLATLTASVQRVGAQNGYFQYGLQVPFRYG